MDCRDNGAADRTDSATNDECHCTDRLFDTRGIRIVRAEVAEGAERAAHGEAPDPNRPRDFDQPAALDRVDGEPRERRNTIGAAKAQEQRVAR